MNVKDQPPWAKLGMSALWVFAYLAVYLFLEPSFGRTLPSFSIFPVAAIAWMFGAGSGFLAGVAFSMGHVVLQFLFHKTPFSAAVDATFVTGFVALVGIGVFVGIIRNSLDKQKLAEKRLQSRERYHHHLNRITHSILASQNVDALMKSLAGELAQLMESDDCYITRWNEDTRQVTPLASTAVLEIPFEKMQVSPEQKTFSHSAIEAGRLLVVEDAQNTPYTSPGLAQQIPAKSVICVPLIAGTTRMGAVIIAYRQSHKFSGEEIQNAAQAGEQIALALLNSQRDNELENRLRESDAMTNIALALSETERIGLTNVLKLIVGSTKELIPGAEQAVIHSLDAENDLLIPEAVVGFDDSREGKAKLRPGEGIAGEAITSRKTLNITDVETDPRFLNLGAPVKFRSLMVTPIISGERVLGTISVQSQQAHAFSNNKERLLHALGIQAAIAIDNARLLENTQQALLETNALYRISRGLVSLNANELLDDAVDLLGKNFGYHIVQVYIMDPETHDFVLKASSGEEGKKLLEAGHSLKAGSGIVGHVAETLEPFFTNDVDQVIFHLKNPLRANVRSEMSVPIKAGEELLGILDIQQTETTHFTQHDLQLAAIVADQLAASLQKAELYESLQKSLQQEKNIRSQLVQNERLAMMGRLLASVSHELNNPLQAIQNALFLLREEKGISPQGSNDLEIVLAESERMAGMIERLRETYRPAQAEDLKPTQINEVIEGVYALVAPHLRKNKVEFSFQPDPSLPTCMAQPDQLRQVALNLLMNGAEAMTDGGTLQVGTQHLRETGEILVSVTDNGQGIPPSILPFIFDPFVTNKKRGTGIGLTISHDIVIKHGGRISAQNNLNGPGATFKVWLPLRALPKEAL